MSTPTEEPQKAEKPGSNPFVLSDKTANRLITVVTSMWVLNILAGMAKFNDYQPSEFVHGAFMVVLGGVFAVRVRG